MCAQQAKTVGHQSQHEQRAQADAAKQKEAPAWRRVMICEFQGWLLAEGSVFGLPDEHAPGVALGTLKWLQGQEAMQGLQIGELAKKIGCPPETIRYYEREGLLPPPVRSAGNYRVYSQAHRTRLEFIRNCRSLDMTLDEVRVLLNIRDLAKHDCSAAHELLDDHIDHVADRIQELQELEKQLRSLRRSCSADRKINGHCAILDDLGRAGPTKKRKTAHVKGSHKLK